MLQEITPEEITKEAATLVQAILEEYELETVNPEMVNPEDALKEVTTEALLTCPFTLRSIVGHDDVWKTLVTLPLTTSMSNIHKVLRESVKKVDPEIANILTKIHGDFFQILHLLYYYVAIGKDEKVLVTYTVHKAVSLLTEVISKFPIKGANHATRPLDAYKKMLALEKYIQDFNTNYILVSKGAVIKNIKNAIQAITLYLNEQFIALERVFSVIYVEYNTNIKEIVEQQTINMVQQPANKNLVVLNENLKTFFAQIKEEMSKNTHHNFKQLKIIADNEDGVCIDNKVLFMTPERTLPRSSISSNAFYIQHGRTPEITPTGITEEVKQSAAFIKKMMAVKKSGNKVLFSSPKLSQKQKKKLIVLQEDSQLLARMNMQDLHDTSAPSSPAEQATFRYASDDYLKFGSSSSKETTPLSGSEQQIPHSLMQAKAKRKLFAANNAEVI